MCVWVCVSSCSHVHKHETRSNLQRPRMKLHGCWAFGWALHLHCMHDTSRKDSASTIEMVAQMIEEVYAICQRTGRKCPTQLMLCLDNTVRENKNSNLISYMNWLCRQPFQMLLTGILAEIPHPRTDWLLGLNWTRANACLLARNCLTHGGRTCMRSWLADQIFGVLCR